jgi:hypothetical protein
MIQSHISSLIKSRTERRKEIRRTFVATAKKDLKTVVDLVNKFSSEEKEFLDHPISMKKLENDIESE